MHSSFLMLKAEYARAGGMRGGTCSTEEISTNNSRFDADQTDHIAVAENGDIGRICDAVNSERGRLRCSRRNRMANFDSSFRRETLVMRRVVKPANREIESGNMM
jgi:hypothetical protein